MTGRVGAVDMAAVALAGSLWVPLILFGQGLLLAVTPCVAQLRGAGSMRSGEHMQGVGHVMRQGIWMALFISVPLIIIVYLISFHLADMGVEGSLGLMTGQYLRAIIWGAPAYLLFVALRCGMEGMALMRPAMFAGFMGLLINIPEFQFVAVHGPVVHRYCGDHPHGVCPWAQVGGGRPRGKPLLMAFGLHGGVLHGDGDHPLEASDRRRLQQRSGGARAGVALAAVRRDLSDYGRRAGGQRRHPARV